MESTAHAVVSAELNFAGISYPVISFSGTEALNTPYCFTLRFQATLISPDEVLGKPACLVVHCTSPSELQWPFSRDIPGIIFKHRVLSPYTPDTTVIEIELRPRMSLMSLSGEPRVYVNQTAREIVHALLLRHGYTHQQLCYDAWTNPPIRYPHWVQAPDERDLDFLHRVLARDGVSYLWRVSQHQQERLLFVDDYYLHPKNLGTPLQKGIQDGLNGLNLNALYELSITEHVLSYQITYRDMDPASPERVMEAQAGRGRRSVMIWGFGAQSQDHLQRAARHHHEQLMMREVELTGLTHNPYLLVGHGFKKHVSWWHDDQFHVLEATHQFSGGHYHNRLTFIPHTTPIRPNPVKREAGQLMHTAVIHSPDDLPYLDKNGHYTYYTHVHHQEATPTLQTAPRLSPYGGKALHQAMGMHFPLRKQAEVVVMYLHNDFNQPILQNSPSNGVNHAPVTRDNSWSMLLKTAWGQYLECCDRYGLETITLANAKGRNRLAILNHQQGHHIELQCARGPMTLTAKQRHTLKSGDDMTWCAGVDTTISTDQNSAMRAQVIHLQADAQLIEAGLLTIEAQGDVEAQAQSMQLTSHGDIRISAQGDVLQIDLPNGDVVWEADYLELDAKDLLLSTPGASIELNDAGITMNAQTIQFNTPQLAKGLVNEQAIPWPPAVIPPQPVVKPTDKVVRYAHEQATELSPPNWQQTFYQDGDTAYVELEIKGFEGHESGQLNVVRHHPKKALKPHPTLSELNNPSIVHTVDFHLNNEELYIDLKEREQTPGTARLCIPIAVHALIQSQSEEHDPYFVRAELGDAKGHHYSNAMLILAKASVTVIQDKSFPFDDKNAILTVARALPDAVKHHPQSPALTDARYYGATIPFERLPVGNRNRITLREAGQRRELLRPDYTLPQPEQAMDVHIHQDNHITLARLMPPMIFDLNGARLHNQQVVFDVDAPQARIELNDEEIAYIKANGNNLTVFIHGFNVAFGQFDKHIEDLKVFFNNLILSGASRLLHKQESSVDATVFRDADFIHQQHPHIDLALIKQDINTNAWRLNGSGMHEWVIHFEHQLNRAAGFDGKNYQPFTRCLFIAWPGMTDGPQNYIDSVYESIRMGPIVAKAIERLHEQVQGLKLHVVAHSQGNGVLLHALNALGTRQEKPLVEHAFLWQAAIPNNALSAHENDGPPPSLKAMLQRQLKNPWYCPYAHRGAEKFTVLFSQNDNILGHLLHEHQQPEGVTLEQVWRRKDPLELIASIAITALNLKAVYGLGVWLDIHLTDLLDEQTLANAWTKWRMKHPTFHVENNPTLFHCEETLDEQYELLKAHWFHIQNDSDFEENILGGCAEVRELLKELKHLTLMEEILRTIIMSSLRRRPAARVLLGAFSLMQKMLRLQNKKEMSDPIISKLLIKFFMRFRPLSRRIWTFMQMTVFAGIKPRPAMGYEGPDKKDQTTKTMRKNGKLTLANTTRWIWHHSDMKIANQDILEKVYKKYIIHGEGVLFGQYEKNN